MQCCTEAFEICLYQDYATKTEAYKSVGKTSSIIVLETTLKNIWQAFFALNPKISVILR